MTEPTSGNEQLPGQQVLADDAVDAPAEQAPAEQVQASDTAGAEVPTPVQAEPASGEQQQ